MPACVPPDDAVRQSPPPTSREGSSGGGGGGEGAEDSSNGGGGGGGDREHCSTVIANPVVAWIEGVAMQMSRRLDVDGWLKDTAVAPPLKDVASRVAENESPL